MKIHRLRRRLTQVQEEILDAQYGLTMAVNGLANSRDELSSSREYRRIELYREVIRKLRAQRNQTLDALDQSHARDIMLERQAS